MSLNSSRSSSSTDPLLLAFGLPGKGVCYFYNKRKGEGRDWELPSASEVSKKKRRIRLQLLLFQLQFCCCFKCLCFSVSFCCCTQQLLFSSIDCRISVSLSLRPGIPFRVCAPSFFLLLLFLLISLIGCVVCCLLAIEPVKVRLGRLIQTGPLPADLVVFYSLKVTFGRPFFFSDYLTFQLSFKINCVIALFRRPV